MKRIFLSILALALLSAGWCPTAEAGPLRRAAHGVKAIGGKVIRGAGRVLRRAAHPFRGC